jgi:hypothetical protein
MTLLSPELALVDPILRADAIADLPPLEPDAFLHFTRREPIAAAPERSPRRPPLAVAAIVYLIAATARTLVIDTLFVVALAGAVFALQALLG